MKIGIVLPSNITYAPYFRIYEKLLNQAGLEFDLIYWNRDLIEESTNGRKFSYDVKDKVNSGDWKKCFKYISFSKFVKSKLSSLAYDRVFFLGTNAATVVILSDYLEKKYKNRYWIDIRDYTYEKYSFYYNRLENAIKSAHTVAISSNGYREFLPDANYIGVHNIDMLNIEKSLGLKNKIKDSFDNPIRISFIGLVRYFDQNKKLINILGNDARFLLQFYGKNSEVIREYCDSKGITNVDFEGRFAPEETANYYIKTDIINNIYGSDDIAVTTALSNKLYFAAALNLPILVSKDTYVEKISTQYGFGYSIDYNNVNFSDDLYNWFKKFKSSEKRGNKKFWDKAQKDNATFELYLYKFINDYGC